jgi:hypothetical protein
MSYNKPSGYLGGEKLFPLSSFFAPKASPTIFEHLEVEFQDFKRFDTFGAHSSLLAIIDNLHLQKGDFVFLPSYICSSALKSFQFRKVKFEFYKVDSTLNIDVESITISDNLKAVLFVDYFGNCHTRELGAFISSLKKRAITVIQDVVHSTILTRDQLYGDYVFNSFRKITPLEGSFILTKSEMQIAYSRKRNWKFLINKRIGQALRYIHLKSGIVSAKSFMAFLNRAEAVYYDSHIYPLPTLNKFLLARFPFSAMASSNRNLYDVLLREFKEFVPVTLQGRNFIPFGFFIVVNLRDELLMRLRRRNIFCPVHWNLPKEVSSDLYSESWSLSSRCLTIPFAYPLTMGSENILYILRQSLPSKHPIDSK